MFSEYRREQEFHNIYKTYVLEKKKKDETQKKTLDQEFTDEINILQRRWNRESVGLEEMDKPARFVCFPMINALYDLMERMTDSLEDKTVETELFKQTYMRAYELYCEVFSNPYCSTYYE